MRRPWAAHALSVRIGGGFDSQQQADQNQSIYLIGFQYRFPGERETSSAPDYETGADVISDGRGAVHFGRRFGLEHLESPPRVRPFVKLGAGIEFAPNDGLAGLLKPANLQARASSGAEFTLARSFDLRIELEVTACSRTQQALALVGYVFDW